MELTQNWCTPKQYTTRAAHKAPQPTSQTGIAMVSGTPAGRHHDSGSAYHAPGKAGATPPALTSTLGRCSRPRIQTIYFARTTTTCGTSFRLDNQ
jgi:hypothetical protein